MSKIEIDGRQVYYVDRNPSGSDPVILIHGLFSNLSVYLFTFVPPLSARHRVFAYDMRSHGNSERRDEGYTLSILSEDLFRLMDAFGMERASLCGYSYGGTVAIHGAATHPERVKKLALIDTPDLTEQRFLDLLGMGSNQAVDEMLEIYAEATRVQISETKKNRIKKRSAFLFDNNQLQENFKESREQLVGLDLKSLNIPVLLLYGKKSLLHDTGAMYADTFPNAKLYYGKGDHNTLPLSSHQFPTMHS